MSPSATPATQNEGGCHQVPCLPLQVARRPGRPSAPPEPAQCPKCHACHAKRRWMSPSATPATQIPWRHWRPSAPPEPAQCHKRHACHAKRRWMSPSATHATRSEGGCWICIRSKPSGQSCINSLRCSSTFRHQKLGLHTLHAPP